MKQIKHKPLPLPFAPYMCGNLNFYLPSIETCTRDYQLNVTFEWHQAGILLMKVPGKFGFTLDWTWTSSTASEYLNYLTIQLHSSHYTIFSHESRLTSHSTFLKGQTHPISCHLVVLSLFSSYQMLLLHKFTKIKNSYLETATKPWKWLIFPIFL